MAELPSNQGSTSKLDIETRQSNFDNLAETTKKLLLIIYKTRENYIHTTNPHPIDRILVYSYDQCATLVNFARTAANLIGINLPLSPNENVIFREIVHRYLKYEAEGLFNLRDIISIPPHEYSKTQASLTTSYGRRTDKFVEDYFEKVKLNI